MCCWSSARAPAPTPIACGSSRIARVVAGYLVDGPDDLRREWFSGKNAVGVTAGASAPELLVQQVVEKLRSLGR